MPAALNITFLGTGTSSGVPMIACNCAVCTSSNSKDKRLRSSILVQSDTTTFVIDTTPDFRQQMLRENVTQLNAVVFTHPHKDHTAGLDDIRAYNYFQQGAIDIYANELTQKALRNEFYYAFAEEKYPGIPQFEMHTITNKLFHVGNIEVLPVEVMHLNMPVLAFRLGNFAYVTDANYISEAEMEKLQGVETLVINALRNEAHISHFTLQQAIDISNTVGAKQTWFTHISHQLGLHHEVQASLPYGKALAYDGLKISVHS